MKTVEYKRVSKPNSKTLCTMQLPKNAEVILDFDKKNGGKLKLPEAFIADAIEHYLEYAITIALKEASCHSKKAQAKKR